MGWILALQPVRRHPRCRLQLTLYYFQNNMGVDRGIVEVPVFIPYITGANPPMITRDFGYGIKIIAYIAILKICFG